MMKITLRRFVSVLVALGITFGCSACCGKKEDENKVVKIDPAQVASKLIHVEGMTCDACEAMIEKTTKNVAGVVSVKADFEAKNVIVEFDQSQTDAKALSLAIGALGYKAGAIEAYSGKVPSSKASTGAGEMKCAAGKCGAGK